MILALSLVGHPMPNIMSATVQWTLPMAWFDGRVFDAASPAFSAILLEVAIAGFLLAVVIFLNTNVAAEIISQVDDKASYLDVDRAMGYCENQLIAAMYEKNSLSVQNSLQSSVFFDGLDSEAHRLMSDCFENRAYETGATIFKNGELSRDLHLITEGHADGTGTAIKVILPSTAASAPPRLSHSSRWRFDLTTKAKSLSYRFFQRQPAARQSHP